ncbi:ParB N-terminal domain-containing protein [Ornithinimicrobium cryptoxanthini]|uniref:ParB N-terminal domain-containing protein n=1 Tax=Ornithinimicrobium cryptoxanthini TaxID=2934161 RepID=UPI0021183F7F|nr:ParB N-terminal domain-containing protein [Ornithinimicrobium cryptoxanthini]
MLNTSSWQRKTLSVHDELHLDPKNVRLETASAQVEADIVEDLFDNENAFDLVDAIGKIGYLTHEIPVVVKRKGKYVVVEGNRRLAALKAIQNPMIAPTHRSRVVAVVKMMTGEERARLASIEVLVAPNQEQADQLIAALHTTNPRKPWSPARQAAFFQAQIDAGKKYKQLVSRYPTIDVPDFVLRARLVNRLKSAVADEAALADFIGSKEWKSGFSALTRIFESKDFREATGIGLDADGNLVTSVSPEIFDEVARLIVQGMQDRSINTRTIGTVKSPRFLRLMADIRAVIDGEPDGKADGTDSATSGEQSASSPGTGARTGAGSGGDPGPGTGSGKAGSTGSRPGSDGSKTATKPTKKAKPNFLPISHIVAPSAYPAAIRLHLEELSIVNIQKTPNATFMMLRAILEKSIKAYADASGEDIKSKRHTNGYVQLHDSLAWLVDFFKANGKTALIQPAQRVQSGKIPNYTASNDAMNAINHNHHFHVDGDEVLNLWTSIDPLMRELMKP